MDNSVYIYLRVGHVYYVILWNNLTQPRYINKVLSDMSAMPATAESAVAYLYLFSHYGPVPLYVKYVY